MGVKTFMLEQTDRVFVYLRRYHFNINGESCQGGLHSYHNAQALVGQEKAAYETREFNNYSHIIRVDDAYKNIYELKYPHSHSLWPTKCDACDYEFKDSDEWQIFTQLMYAMPNGELISIQNPPEGAMYFAWWQKNNPRYAPTGPLYATCPGGFPWNIDGRASNCTMPNDDEHRCWIRHGDPPNITVDKNGNTCSAGGGSIEAGSYHGFLRNGEFT